MSPSGHLYKKSRSSSGKVGLQIRKIILKFWYDKSREMNISLDLKNRIWKIVNGRVFSPRAAWLEYATSSTEPPASHGLRAHGVFVLLCPRSCWGPRALQQLRWCAHSLLRNFSEKSEQDRSMHAFRIENIHQHRFLRSLRESPGAAELDASSWVSSTKWARPL